jgi:HSP20 family protein
MTLVKFNKRRRPWFGEGVTSWLDTDEFFSDDYLTNDNNLPAMNVKEKKDKFEIELAVPGFSKEDIEVTIENDLLHVFAKKSKEEIEEDQSGYTRREFNYNEFDRKLKLPTSVNRNENVKAVYKHGILKLNLEKKEEAKKIPKKVIKVS